MRSGLIIGKFYPLHLGHLSLIEFGIKQCDQLHVLICAADTEYIPGEIRLKWIQLSFGNDENVLPVLYNYSESELPNTSVSSKEVSKVWAQKIKNIISTIDVIFSSEPYGEYLAEYLNCEHIYFQPDRKSFPIHASSIRNNSNSFWEYIAPAARPFFVKKIIISGTESTGKSTLTKRLSQHYNTSMVPEIGRDVVPETEVCTREHLHLIAILHAQKIIEEQQKATRFLFIDTDINITRSYSRYLFKEDLTVEPWIDEANTGDMYLFLESDAPYIQDGTRLDQLRRNELSLFHKEELSKRNISFECITGNWQERFDKSVEIINAKWIQRQ